MSDILFITKVKENLTITILYSFTKLLLIQLQLEVMIHIPPINRGSKYIIVLVYRYTSMCVYKQTGANMFVYVYLHVIESKYFSKVLLKKSSTIILLSTTLFTRIKIELL